MKVVLTKIGMAVHFLAALCLLFAATIHTFPPLLGKWDDYIAVHPGTHFEIGLFGFIVGILNLCFLFGQKWLTERV